MNAYWLKYVAWFNGRAPREKVILGLATVFCIVFVGYSFAIEPALLREKRALGGSVEARNTLAALQQQVIILRAGAADPNDKLRAEEARLQATFNEQAQRFRVVERSTVPPEQMSELLESLLSRSPNLQLVSLRTLPAAPIIKPPEPKPGDKATGAAPTNVPVANMYRHGVDLTIAGSFAELLAYLENLEAAAPGLGWARIELRTEEYPRSVLNLSVQTLSLKSEWLTL